MQGVSVRVTASATRQPAGAGGGEEGKAGGAAGPAGDGDEEVGVDEGLRGFVLDGYPAAGLAKGKRTPSADGGVGGERQRWSSVSTSGGEQISVADCSVKEAQKAQRR